LTTEYFICFCHVETIPAGITTASNDIWLTYTLTGYSMTGACSTDSTEWWAVTRWATKRVGDLHIVVVLLASTAGGTLHILFTITTILNKKVSFSTDL